MKPVFLIFIMLKSLTSFAASEEMLLIREAELLAEKTFITNTALIDIDPATCKTSENTALMLKNLKDTRKGILTHCKSTIADKLAAIEADLKQVSQGVFLPRTSSIGPLLPQPSSLPARSNKLEAGLAYMPTEIVTEHSSVEAAVSPQIDHTGLTQEERDRINSYFEKRDYEPTAEDGLFNILSKAYMRNLKRIFSP